MALTLEQRLEVLRPDLLWQIQKYLRHPTADLVKTKAFREKRLSRIAGAAGHDAELPEHFVGLDKWRLGDDYTGGKAWDEIYQAWYDHYQSS